ncbi:MAG: flavin reductase family protein [Rikenellaceae bacterium]|nr:flavin reductase family protein [Rikenellaceae bacterium]
MVALSALMAACGNKSRTGEPAAMESPDSVETIRWNGYTKIEPTQIDRNAVALFSEDWALITAGDEKSFNTMTASWGALGELWMRPVSIIFVRESRYTHQFLERNEYYTLSFFDEQYREQLMLLGTRSGRDGDKVKESGLTPMVTPSGSMAFEEAHMIIECRKLYSIAFRQEDFSDPAVYRAIYGGNDPSRHTQFIGEIVGVWVR